MKLQKAKKVCWLAAFIALTLVSLSQAEPTIVMDGTLHNGSFSGVTAGYWYNTPGAIPAGWTETAIYMYSTAAGWIQCGTNAVAINNTGELVQGGHAYTINADLGSDSLAIVRVYATQNADGTGNKALLAELDRPGETGNGYTLFPCTVTGDGVSYTLDGYYVQVVIGAPYSYKNCYVAGYYDNIVVTSESAITRSYMNGTLHNGSFSGASAGFWYNTPAAIPSGWVETALHMYTTGLGRVQCGSVAEAVNNTGEVVQGGHAYTISADLGGGTGTLATVRVYATQNANGTGNKSLLAELNRLGEATDGTNIFPCTITGDGIPQALGGYYLQVVIGGPYAYKNRYLAGTYDNIVVTSGPATTRVYMNSSINNGSLTAEAVNVFWTSTNEPNVPGWTLVSGTPWLAAVGFIGNSTAGLFLNNTGESITGSHRFTVSASLGAGTNPSVKVYATQNSDGTGAKMLLAQVSRQGLPGDGYNLFTVTSAPGMVTPPSIQGYFVQVVCDGGGNYDNIVVMSEATEEAAMTVYINQDYNNGGMLSDEVSGPWSEAWFIPYGWTTAEEDLTEIWTAAVRFITFDSEAAGVYNNTGEVIAANQLFTLSADLNGKPGATAQVFAYATENIDGTGQKVLLADLSVAGTDTTNSYQLFTHTTTGAVSDESIAGYYAQIMLVTAGDPNLTGYYDNIVLTSIEVSTAPKTYMDVVLHNGGVSAAAAGYWTNPDSVAVGWTATDPAYAYTFSALITALESRGGDVYNNTQETVVSNQKFTVTADLGGDTGAEAEIMVYATENWDGTGEKVLLVSLSRNGNSADGLDLTTVSATGALVPGNLNGYYVQVVMKTTGANDLNAYYDNIIVTSAPAGVCGDDNYPQPVGDLSGDCIVNEVDLNLFAAQWLADECAAETWCGGADLNQSSEVDLVDFAQFADNWLVCNSPDGC